MSYVNRESRLSPVGMMTTSRLEPSIGKKFALADGGITKDNFEQHLIEFSACSHEYGEPPLVNGGRLFSDEQQRRHTVRLSKTRGVLVNLENKKGFSPDKLYIYSIIEDANYPFGKNERMIICHESCAKHPQLTQLDSSKHNGECRFSADGALEILNYRSGSYKNPSIEGCDQTRNERRQEILDKQQVKGKKLSPKEFKQQLEKLDEDYKKSAQRARLSELYPIKKLYPFFNDKMKERYRDILDRDDISTTILEPEHLSERCSSFGSEYSPE